MISKDLIKKIIKEESKKPISLRRRFDPEFLNKEFENALDIVTTRYVKNMDRWNSMNLSKFATMVISQFVDIVYQEMTLNSYDNDLLDWNDLWIGLLEYFEDPIKKTYKAINRDDISEIVKKKLSKMKSIMGLINESGLSPYLRRRLLSDEMIGNLNSVLEWEINPYLYDNPTSFLEDVCDYMVNNILEDFEFTLGMNEVSPKDKDSLYFFLIDTYGKYIIKYYIKHNEKKNIK